MQNCIFGGSACARVHIGRLRLSAPPPRAPIQVGSGHH